MTSLPRDPFTAGKISRWTPTPILSCCGGLPDPKNSARGGIGLARACRWRASGGRKAGFQGSSPVVRGPRATEAAAAALRFGLIDRNLGQIISIAQAGNGASERVMGKLGMRLARETVDPACDRPVRVYAITSAQYLAAGPRSNGDGAARRHVSVLSGKVWVACISEVNRPAFTPGSCRIIWSTSSGTVRGRPDANAGRGEASGLPPRRRRGKISPRSARRREADVTPHSPLNQADLVRLG